MKKLLLIGLCFFMLSCNRLPSVNKHPLPIYYRFRGGPAGFKSFFTNNIKLSDTACCVVGNLITRVSVSPDGIINKIEIVNPVDSIIESEMIRVIKLSEKYWKKCDSADHDDVFYIQAVISTKTFIPNYYRPSTEGLKRYFPEPVFITRYDIDHQSGFEVSENQVIHGKLNTLLDSGKYEESLPFINELIRRDPFSRDLYKARIMINFKLERDQQVIADDNKLMNFAEGYSLDDILRDIDRKTESGKK